MAVESFYGNIQLGLSIRQSQMKILVIDNAGQLASFFLGIDAELNYFADEIKALNAAEKQKPELIFLNYVVRGWQTPEYIQLLLEVSAATKVVVIGNNTSEDDVFRCLLTGAKGYQETGQLSHYIDKLVHVVAQGEAWISRKMVARAFQAIWQLNVQSAAA